MSKKIDPEVAWMLRHGLTGDDLMWAEFKLMGFAFGAVSVLVGIVLTILWLVG